MNKQLLLFPSPTRTVCVGIGDTNLDAIRDANLRLHHVTANSIIVLMDALHGTLTEADINAFLEAPNPKLKSVTAFDAHNATYFQ
jgi:hypothetical protein